MTTDTAAGTALAPGNTFQLAFGAMMPTIAVQIKKQHLKYKTDDAKHFDHLRKCLFELYLADLIPEKQYEIAKTRLWNRIARHVELNNKGVKIQKLKYA